MISTVNSYNKFTELCLDKYQGIIRILLLRMKKLELQMHKIQD